MTLGCRTPDCSTGKPVFALGLCRPCWNEYAAMRRQLPRTAPCTGAATRQWRGATWRTRRVRARVQNKPQADLSTALENAKRVRISWGADAAHADAPGNDGDLRTARAAVRSVMASAEARLQNQRPAGHTVPAWRCGSVGSAVPGQHQEVLFSHVQEHLRRT